MKIFNKWRSLPQQEEQQKQQEQAQLMMRNIKEFGKYSYEQELARERSLLDQAGKMLTAFALFTAALNMLLPVVLTHATIPISKNKLICLVGIITFVLLASLVMAILAQWRYEYKGMQDGQAWYKHVKDNYQDYATQANFDRVWMEQLKELHDAIRKNNNRRATQIIASMTIFLVAVLMVALASLFTIIRFFV